MSNSTRETHLDQTHADRGLHWQFANGDVVLIRYDARTLSQAPWNGRNGNGPSGDGVSTGFIYDCPDEQEVIVLPHVTDVPFDGDDSSEQGEVVIPYSSIRHITLLFSPTSLHNVLGGIGGRNQQRYVH
jgi:hypothetical protein